MEVKILYTYYIIRTCPRTKLGVIKNLLMDIEYYIIVNMIVHCYKSFMRRWP